MDLNTIYINSDFPSYHSFYDTIKLPYSFEDIKIQSNELSNYSTVNTSIEKLFNNFLYIYGWTKFASTDIPLLDYHIAGNYGGSFIWSTSLSSTEFNLFNNTLDNMDVIVPLVGDNLTLFVGSRNYLSVLSSNLEMTTITSSYSATQTTLNSVFNFIDISSIVYTNNRIYVVDSSNNAVFLYNIQLIPSVSVTILKTLNGLGTYQDNSRFNNPTVIDTNSQNIFILDAGNYCIKIYDLDLNWISSYNIKQITNKTPIHIALDRDYIYITMSDSSLLVMDLDFNLIQNTQLNIGVGEIFKSLFFAKSNTNIFYILTDKNIYKCNKLTPNIYINKFNIQQFGISSESFQSANSVSYNNQDLIFCVSTSNLTNSSKILQFTDDDSFISSLTEASFDVYSLDDIKITPTEYNQDTTYNKMLYYLSYNHYEMQKRLKGKFVGTYDTQNNLYLANIDYNLNTSPTNTSANLFIGQNEIFSNSVINRCLEEVYNIQLDIVDKITPIIIDSQTSLNVPVVLQ